jgi:hypothetical protein
LVGTLDTDSRLIYGLVMPPIVRSHIWRGSTPFHALRAALWRNTLLRGWNSSDWR